MTRVLTSESRGIAVLLVATIGCSGGDPFPALRRSSLAVAEEQGGVTACWITTRGTGVSAIECAGISSLGVVGPQANSALRELETPLAVSLNSTHVFGAIRMNDRIEIRSALRGAGGSLGTWSVLHGYTTKTAGVRFVRVSSQTMGVVLLGDAPGGTLEAVGATDGTNWHDIGVPTDLPSIREPGATWLSVPRDGAFDLGFVALSGSWRVVTVPTDGAATSSAEGRVVRMSADTPRSIAQCGPHVLFSRVASGGTEPVPDVAVWSYNPETDAEAVVDISVEHLTGFDAFCARTGAILHTGNSDGIRELVAINDVSVAHRVTIPTNYTYVAIDAASDGARTVAALFDLDWKVYVATDIFSATPVLVSTAD